MMRMAEQVVHCDRDDGKGRWTGDGLTETTSGGQSLA
jgi:hypothetical protein